MAGSKVKLDYKEFEKLKNKMTKLGDPNDLDKFLQFCAKELAARLLAKVVKRTPVGQYPEGSGKMGGTLRRGWAGGNVNAQNYALSLPVSKVGNDYVITITNPVEYASYVEFGHRTRNHQGWVEGQFMLTISEKEIQDSAPAILEKKLNDYLKGLVK